MAPAIRACSMTGCFWGLRALCPKLSSTCCAPGCSAGCGTRPPAVNCASACPAVHKIPTHPAYAGPYVYGRTRSERYIDASGAPAGRRRVTRAEDWQVLLADHHPGYIDWDTYLANTARLAANMPPARGADGTGATREGCALLQGLAICGYAGAGSACSTADRPKASPVTSATAASWSAAGRAGSAPG